MNEHIGQTSTIESHPNYSIKDLEKLTGVKAHTLRIWEKRYHVTEPDRTQTNIRRYDDQDLKKLLLVSILNNHGQKISKIANLPVSELNRMVNELSAETTEMDVFIDQLVISMIEMDEASFHTQINDLTSWFGFEHVTLNVLFPFCEKIGVLWLIEKIHPVHEHFISNFIKQKLFSQIDALPTPSNEKGTVVLYLKENEFHELGLLFYSYLLKKSNFKTVYLGQSVPMDDLRRVVEYHNPKLIVSAMVTKTSPTQTQQYFDEISTLFPNNQFIFSGHHLNTIEIEYPQNIRHIRSASDLKETISSDLV